MTVRGGYGGQLWPAGLECRFGNFELLQRSAVDAVRISWHQRCHVGRWRLRCFPSSFLAPALLCPLQERDWTTLHVELVARCKKYPASCNSHACCYRSHPTSSQHLVLVQFAALASKNFSVIPCISVKPEIFRKPRESATMLDLVARLTESLHMRQIRDWVSNATDANVTAGSFELVFVF